MPFKRIALAPIDRSPGRLANLGFRVTVKVAEFLEIRPRKSKFLPVSWLGIWLVLNVHVEFVAEIVTKPFRLWRDATSLIDDV